MVTAKLLLISRNTILKWRYIHPNPINIYTSNSTHFTVPGGATYVQSLPLYSSAACVWPYTGALGNFHHTGSKLHWCTSHGRYSGPYTAYLCRHCLWPTAAFWCLCCWSNPGTIGNGRCCNGCESTFWHALYLIRRSCSGAKPLRLSVLSHILWWRLLIRRIEVPN